VLRSSLVNARWLLAGLFAVTSCFAAANVAETAAPSATPTPSDNRAFLWLRNVDGFNSIDDQHIVLSAGRKQALVTTFGPCLGLRDSETIAVDAPLGYLDKSGLGEIVYRRGFHDRGRCPIDRIVAVDSLAQAREIVAKEKADKQSGGPSR
jgi:hypothetical protein